MNMAHQMIYLDKNIHQNKAMESSDLFSDRFFGYPQDDFPGMFAHHHGQAPKKWVKGTPNLINTSVSVQSQNPVILCKNSTGWWFEPL